MKQDRMFLICLLCCLTITQGTSVGNFYGGSISYTIKNSSISGKTEIHLDVITGWKLGQGPCGPGCGNKDVGKSTMTVRRHTSFGNWSEVIKTMHVRNTTKKDVTSTIIYNAKTQVLAVSEKDGWEQELLQSTIQLENNAENVGIIHRGMAWHDLIQGSNLPWTIQAKVFSKKRNDTGSLNNSPVVMVRPLYILELNKINTINVHVVDPDDDFVKCRKADFSYAGGLILPKGANIKENCEVLLNTSGYHEDSWIAIAVEVEDYNIYPITYGTDPYRTAQFGLSSTTVQFLVNVISTIQSPSFVDPTLPNGHVVDIYIGATWTTGVYTKAKVGKTIDRITFIGRHNEQVQNTGKQNDPVRPGVVFTMMSWKPEVADIGQHIICARIVDNNGNSGATSSLKQTRVPLIIENIFNKTATVSNRPYFIDFPNLSQVISCTLGSTCVLPIFIKSKASIQNVKTTKNTGGPVIIEQTFTRETHNNESVYSTELSFLHNVDGALQVCIDATDTNGKSSDETCVNIDVKPPDPCLWDPCKNSAFCSTNQHNRKDYICTCFTSQFYGKDCERKKDPCSPNPCSHGAACYDMYPSVYCSCSGEWKGSFCNETDKCSSQPTNGTTSVIQTVNGMKVGDTTTYTCHTGYEDLTSSLTIQCLLSGDWKLPPTCTLKDCGQPSPGTHSTCSPNSTTTYSSSAACTCDKGYTSSAPMYIVCRETGTWDVSPACAPKDCTSHLPVGNHYKCVVGSATTYGTIAKCTCEHGYVSTATMTIQCLETGLWDTPPICSKKAISSTDSLPAKVPVIAGASCGGIVILAGIIALCVIRKNKLKKQQVSSANDNVLNT